MSDREKIASLSEEYNKIKSEISRVIVGQEKVIEELLICLFARGHTIIVGVPGLAKTLLIQSLAQTLDLKFSRIQFTPDLMPSDIMGTDVIEENLETGRKGFRFIKGPIFANIILADEINRTPPKTQAALLEAMQERKVTAGGQTYLLEEPFFVAGTQNPIEQEGTYPLPEAQLDRFFFQINIFYPSFEEEKEIVLKTTSAWEENLSKVISKERILEVQRFVRTIPISQNVLEYAVNIVRKTRAPDGPSHITKWLSWGAGPRAAQTIVLASKIRAALRGKFSPEKEDVASVAKAALRHRIILNFSAEAEGKTPDGIIEQILAEE